jgi:hypothetical protein
MQHQSETITIINVTTTTTTTTATRQIKDVIAEKKKDGKVKRCMDNSHIT